MNRCSIQSAGLTTPGGLLSAGPLRRVTCESSAVRRAFAHEAVLAVDAAFDSRAPGATVTIALCGHWDHEPPCPLAPHYTEVTWVGADLHVRVLFAVEPGREGDIRTRLDRALQSGHHGDQDGAISEWRLRSVGPSEVANHERAHVSRLAATL